MKPLIFLFFGLIFICLVFVASTDAKLTPKNASGIWLLDENKGDIVQDSSDNKNDGKIQGAKWVNGKIGSALSFDGATARVVIPDADSLDLPAAWTITAWIYVNKTESGYGHILGKRSGTGTNYAFRTSQTGTGWESYFWKGAWMGIWGQGSVKKGEWLYMTSVYDGKAIITIYENGVQIGSGNVGPPPPVDTSEVHLAGWQSNTSELLDGMLDEVALFNVALTVEEIENLMKNGIQKTLGFISVNKLGKLASKWGGMKIHK